MTHRSKKALYKGLINLELCGAQSMSPGLSAFHRAIEHEDAGQFAEAQASYREAVAMDPAHARSWNNLGTLLEREGRDEQATEAYRRAVAAEPMLVVALANLAMILHRIGRRGEAGRIVASALAASTTRTAQEWELLAQVLQGIGRKDDAVTAFDRAVTADPALRSAHVARLTCLLNLGRTSEVVRGYKTLLEASAPDADAARRMLLALAFEPCSTQEYFDAHLEAWSRIPGTPRPVRAALPQSGRLRVGYVSADYRSHPMGVVLAPIIAAHDRNAIEVCLYSDVTWPDAATHWFERHADRWFSIAGLTDEEAATRITEDGVDILVHVAGHFDDNRPLLARQRAAPVQISFWDTATSGLPEMDYLIADRGIVPRRSSERFTERVVCIPTIYVRTMDSAPDIPASRPFGGAGLVFGSFNAPAKISEPTLAIWLELLLGIPNAVLVFQYQDIYEIPSVRKRVLAGFRAAGLDSRVRFLGQATGHPLERYLSADIALDPFPFNGMTTTFEALWMGVPVIALEGDRMVGRCAANALRKVGLNDWVAGTIAEYIEIAIRADAQRGELERLRRELRARVARSPLCDARARARQLERVYRAVWQRALPDVQAIC